MAYRASHILVKYDGSARQASWRDPEGTTIRARTREMAAKTLSDIRAQLQALEGWQRAERFAVLARETSDCGTAREGGDLGVLQAGEMMQEFEEAVNHIVVGDLSEVIQTESGTIRLSAIDDFAGLQLSWLDWNVCWSCRSSHYPTHTFIFFLPRYAHPRETPRCAFKQRVGRFNACGIQRWSV